MMIIANKYDIGQRVYLKTDTEQYVRLVTAIFIYPNNLIAYQLQSGAEMSLHYDFEIRAVKKYSE